MTIVLKVVYLSNNAFEKDEKNIIVPLSNKGLELKW